MVMRACPYQNVCAVVNKLIIYSLLVYNLITEDSPPQYYTPFILLRAHRITAIHYVV